MTCLHFSERIYCVFILQELGKQQENLKDLDKDFGKDYSFSESELGGAAKDFSPPQDQPQKHGGAEGPSYAYASSGSFPNVVEMGDSIRNPNPISAKVNAKLFGGFRDPGYSFSATYGQSRAFHQDHSSVGGLTAEDIDKARQAKADPQHKPHKQMVRRLFSKTGGLGAAPFPAAPSNLNVTTVSG